MNKINLYNTLSGKKEEFKPIKKGKVGLYTCGPTVYDFAHLGNLRAYIFEDILKRVLTYNGLKVKHVMNITDVGHLSGDMDMGEDKMEKGSRREGKTAWDIADFYTIAFMKDIKALNIIFPTDLPRATEYINEQIDLVRILEKKGFTYITSDGVYFDTSKLKDYNKLSHKPLDELFEGARVEKNDEKKNPTDFALWKFSAQGAKRQMEWESPWGIGFPGWHLECSAMSLKTLGKMLDIHCGGIDHIDIHHTNEIAQSEAATGKKFFNYWLHGAFLNIQGGKKMAKSQGNFLTLKNAVIDQGLDPLAYRFAALQTHYRKPMEYSNEAIQNSAKGLEHLRNQVRELKPQNKQPGKGVISKDYQEKFVKAINDDLNIPQALAVAQDMLKSDMPGKDKLATILNFDRVLGLELDKANDSGLVPDDIKKLAEEREESRREKNWSRADELRKQIEDKGYAIEDRSAGGPRIYKAI